MKVKELLQIGIDKLKEANIDEAIFKAKLVMAYVLDKPKEYLITHSDEELEEKQVNDVLNGIDKLVQGIPLEYITNKREFMRLNFYVNEDVLIPRQDTEILVEEVIKKCKQGKILDLCTGSGAIGISLAKYIPETIVYASDISEKALKIAKRNARENNVKVKFIQSDLFENIQEKDFDVIVSNPPYVETAAIETLEENVKKEPILALDGGEDGLDFYRNIIMNAPMYLKQGGMLALEIGYNQAEAVCNLLKENGNYDNTKVVKDLGENDRVVLANIM